MVERFVNESVFNYIFSREWANLIVVNQYPLLIIIWNLFLLLLPFIVVKLMSRYYLGYRLGNKVWKISVLIAGMFLWIILIPNSAYIITGIRHLLGYCPLGSYQDVCVENAWMIIFFFIYAVSGWVFYVLLMNQMKRFLTKAFSKEAAEIFIYAIIPVIALGVLLGLINRFNSWGIFVKPLMIFDVMLTYLTNFIYFINWLVFTIGLYVLYIAGNILVKAKIK